LKLVTLALATLTALLTGAPSAFAHDQFDKEQGIINETPKELQDVGIDEHIGQNVDLDLKFKDEDGKPVTLRQIVGKDGQAAILSLAYYSCPSLCSFHLNGLKDAFKQIKKPLGSEFQAIVVSIEPKETPELAAAKKRNYIKAYGRPEGAAGWHFLTGDQAAIATLAKQVGFKFRWDEQQKQWAHASAAAVLTPTGEISRYLYGIVFDPKTVRLSAIEAADGKTGSVLDRVILYCFHYNASSSKYSPMLSNIMAGGGAIMIIVMLIFLAPFWLGKKRQEERPRSQGES
jgi:protein SCO1/2